jgi:hypothetical protein
MSKLDLSQLITAEAKSQSARTTAFAALAALRWRRETGGLILPDGRQTLTTREAQAKLANTVTALRVGLMTGPVDWKLASGWQQMTEVEMTQLAMAVRDHVNCCFAAEQAVAEEMAAQPGGLADFKIAAAFDVAFDTALAERAGA